MVPLCFAPFMYFLISNMTGSPLAMLFFVLVGMCTWGFSEYTLHRFVFHGEDTWMKMIPPSGAFYAFHFMIHGIHHAFPQDAMRLVFPPTIGYAIIYFIFYPLSMLLIPEFCRFSVATGFVIGY